MFFWNSDPSSQRGKQADQKQPERQETGVRVKEGEGEGVGEGEREGEGGPGSCPSAEAVVEEAQEPSAVHEGVDNHVLR